MTDEHASRPPATSGVSVVVPTHSGRLPLLRLLLDSVCASARCLAEPWECIVVDDSPAGERDAVREACRAHGARYERGPWRAGTKRNIGAAAAQYDLLVFVDSDCQVSEGFLSAHAETLRSAPPGTAGVVGLTEFFGEASFLWQVADRSRVWSSFGWARPFRQVLWGPTVNLSMWASTFREVGGFEDDAWTAAGGEDVSLGIRLTEAGWRLLTSREALALHHRDHVRLPQMTQRFFMYGEADAYLCAAFPARTHRHLSPLLLVAAAGAAGLVAPGRIPAAVRLAAPLATAVVCVGSDLRRRRAQRRRYRRPGPAEGDQGVGGWRSLLLDLACVPFAAASDLGAALQAVRARRPGLLWRRFDFINGSEFVRRERPPER